MLNRLRENKKILQDLPLKEIVLRWKNCFNHIGWEKCQRRTCDENMEGWCHYKWVAIPAFIWAVETTEGINHDR